MFLESNSYVEGCEHDIDNLTKPVFEQRLSFYQSVSNRALTLLEKAPQGIGPRRELEIPGVYDLPSKIDLNVCEHTKIIPNNRNPS